MKGSYGIKKLYGGAGRGYGGGERICHRKDTQRTLIQVGLLFFTRS